MYPDTPRSDATTPGAASAQGSLVATLDQIARLIEAAGLGHGDARERRRAQQLALTLDERSPNRSHGAEPQLLFAGALLGDLAVDLVADTAAAARLIDDLEQIVGLSVAGLGREVLRGSHLSQLPVDVALAVQLSLLLLFTEVATISLWTHSDGGEARLLAQVGDPCSESVQVGAAELMAGDHRTAAGESWTGRLVERGQLPPATVIASGAEADRARSDLLLDAAAPQIAAILDRTELLAAGEDDSSEMIASLERRLARLRYDLHDGPQQDVHLLALDLRLFRDQLGSVVEGQPNADRLMGRLDDLEAQLVALDSELRQISTSMQSPFLPAGTLPEALEEITRAFAARTSIHPEVDLSGNFGQLSDSQQITLLALIREALNNVQKHSQATRATITIAAHSRGVDAQVVDDGRGFDPEQTLVKAAREGHLGVVGIHERVRMLGGHARIESRPGGPTVISVTIPSWAPAQAGPSLVDRR